MAEALCRRGARVTVVDNLSLGTVANLAWRQGADDLEFIPGDIADEGLLWLVHEMKKAGELPPPFYMQCNVGDDYFLPSSSARRVAASTAPMTVARKLPFSSACRPAMVVPPG